MYISPSMQLAEKLSHLADDVGGFLAKHPDVKDTRRPNCSQIVKGVYASVPFILSISADMPVAVPEAPVSDLAAVLGVEVAGADWFDLIDRVRALLRKE